MLERSKAREDEVEKKILAIIQRKKDGTFWCRLNYKLGKKRGNSIPSVQVEESLGQTVEYNTQESVHEVIWEEVQFYLEEQAPICQGRLKRDFCYTVVSPIAKAVLDRTYDYPDNFDEPTRELCQKCAEIRSKIPKGSVSTLIPQEAWQTRWKTSKDVTSSSKSGPHFCHYYRDGAQPVLIFHFHALKTSLTLKRGVSLTRWSRKLSVMLEKMFECTLIFKL